MAINPTQRKQRPLDVPDETRKTISADDSRIQAIGKQAPHGMTDQQIARRGQMAGATLAKSLHALPANLTAAIDAERRSYGDEAGRQLAKAIIAAPARLRYAVPLASALKRMNGK